MNLLLHDLIEGERHKDRLAEAAQWRLVKEIKQEQMKQDKPRVGMIFFQILESGRDWLSDVTLFRKSSKEKINVKS